MGSARLDDVAHQLLAQKEETGEWPAGAGVAVSVVRGNEVLFRGAYGLRERDRALPVTPETIFEICSLTKAFTSAALLGAVEAGRIDLDAPLNAASERIRLRNPAATRTVSLADVLSHRTGLPSNDLLFYFGSMTNDDVRRAVGELELVPGGFRKVFNYNNLLYGALGGVFPELAGTSWEASVAKKLLAPLEMRSTSFGGPIDETNLALPYVGTRRVARVDMSAVAAAGAMRSSLDDMTRWLAFHLSRGRTSRGEQLLAPASIETMQRPHIAARGVNPLILQGFEWLGEPSYGLGWFLGSAHGLAAVFHPGFADGFSAAIVMFPEQNVGCIALSNLNLSAVPGQLAQALLETALGLEREEPPRGPAPPEEALRFVGEYEHPVFGAVSIERRGDRLVLVYNGNAWPLRWKDAATADFDAPAFGVKIPLSVRLETASGGARQLAIPFSLDPRVGPQIFAERRRPSS